MLYFCGHCLFLFKSDSWAKIGLVSPVSSILYTLDPFASLVTGFASVFNINPVLPASIRQARLLEYFGSHALARSILLVERTLTQSDTENFKGARYIFLIFRAYLFSQNLSHVDFESTNVSGAAITPMAISQ